MTKKQTQPDTSAPRLWVVLARAYGSLAAYVEACIAAEGLCLSDFMVLEVLLHKGPLTMSEICEKVLLANASMTSAIDRLDARGFVVRSSTPGDRRVRIAALTAAGRAFISEIYKRHAHDIESVVSVLDARERTRLRASLKKLGLAARQAALDLSATATDTHPVKTRSTQ